mgnify:CR=1 FL=1
MMSKIQSGEANDASKNPWLRAAAKAGVDLNGEYTEALCEGYLKQEGVQMEDMRYHLNFWKLWSTLDIYDRQIIHEACDMVSTRAARLSAAAIGAVVRKIHKEDSCTVAIDGSVFEHYPYFKQNMQIALLEMLGDKKQVKFISVLVSPTDKTLEKIKDLNFDYYQLYDVSPERTKDIKFKYKKKIITAITVSSEDDVIKYKDFSNISDIILFDSKGYHKSESFDHSLLDDKKSWYATLNPSLSRVLGDQVSCFCLVVSEILIGVPSGLDVSNITEPVKPTIPAIS